MPLWIFVDDGNSTTATKAEQGPVAFAGAEALAVVVLPGESGNADSNTDHVAVVRGVLRKVKQESDIDLHWICCI